MKVVIEYYPISNILTISKIGKKSENSDITPDFLKAYEKVIKQLEPSLKELANK